MHNTSTWSTIGEELRACLQEDCAAREAVPRVDIEPE
jgi:hypothetical protein